MKLFSVTICASKISENELEIIHIIAQNEESAFEIALELARKKWSVEEGWGHHRVVIIIPEDPYWS